MNRKSTWTSVLLLIMLACLNLTNLNTILYSEYPELVREDKVDRVFYLRTKFAGLDEIVEKSSGVGFFSDLGNNKDSTEYFREVGLIQYAIAPLKIFPQKNMKFVIGHSSASQLPDSLPELKLRLLKRVDDHLGIYLRDKN